MNLPVHWHAETAQGHNLKVAQQVKPGFWHTTSICTVTVTELACLVHGTEWPFAVTVTVAVIWRQAVRVCTKLYHRWWPGPRGGSESEPLSPSPSAFKLLIMESRNVKMKTWLSLPGGAINQKRWRKSLDLGLRTLAVRISVSSEWLPLWRHEMLGPAEAGFWHVPLEPLRKVDFSESKSKNQPPSFQVA